MNHRKSIFIVLLISFLFLFLLYYIDNNNHRERVSNKKIESNSFKGQKLNFLVTIPHIRAARAIAKWFHKKTGATIQVTEKNYSELLSSILKDIHSKNPRYDIFMIWYPELGDLFSNNALLDLTDWIQKNKEIIEPEDFIPGIYKAYTTQNDRRWAVPFDGDTQILFYRKSLLKKYNFKPPETWNEFFKISKTITLNEKKNGIYGSAIIAYNTPILLLSSFLNRVGSNGGSLLSKNGKPNINSPENLKALLQLKKHIKYALPSPFETNFEVSRDAFLSGKVAMVEQWTDIGVMAESKSESKVAGDWGAIQIPMGSGKKARHSSALNAGYALGISSKTKNEKLAKTFLLFIMQREVMLKYNTLNGGVDPTRISILNSKEYKEFAPIISKASFSALKNATPWPSIPKSSILFKALSNYVEKALKNKMAPGEALMQAQKDWENILYHSK